MVLLADLKVNLVPFTEFGKMKSLETAIFSKNHIRSVPVELSACSTLRELLLSDNDIVEIPTKIMTMPNLKVFEAESE